MKALLAGLFSILLLQVTMSLVSAAEPLELPAPDLEPPVIVFDESDTEIYEGITTFTAAVADNVGVAKVTLFYRSQTDTVFKTKPMQQSNKVPDLYTAELPVDSFKSGALEYYIRADDVSDNSIFLGQKFAPLTFKVGPDSDTSGIDKAQAGVFEDFNTGLQSGVDRSEIPIGFFTFRDSDKSVVSISTTSHHPQLPGEEDDNKVLQVDFDVKTAWAGVIHNFENTAVNRWAPRDWSEFNEFSFWLYGNNTNTSLFVEILDNRKPRPTPGGAEVYTFTFADNFSGWKQITVPFEKLVRKENYDDAPNDGLGLSEVHGWAFGTLNTDGPITYYIDDFEIR